ncbi:MAG TPA: DUF1566 domain-containing protein [Caulobacteraceae bacterium]|nr:DUF1566 domain-containing protein [Caulobacteraceae bacterium]
MAIAQWKAARGVLAGCLAMVCGAPAWANCDPSAPSNTPASRYEIKGATAYDRQSGLTWQRCSVGQQWSEAGGCVGPVEQLSWDAAQKQGSDGWRAPTLRELQTLISTNCGFPAINEDVFPGMDRSNLWYWSSTPGDLVVAWGVGFGRGDPDSSWKTNTVSVRLVRSGRL